MTEKKAKSQTAEMIKNALILFAITLVAGVLLGIVYELTKTEIARQEAQAIVDANHDVFADAASFSKIYDESGDTDENDPALEERFREAWAALQESNRDFSKVTLSSVTKAKGADDEVTGYIVNVASSGYGSRIQFSVGLTMEGHLNGISIISIGESPGLGMEAEPVLVPQFNGYDASTGENNGRDDMPFTVVKSDNPGMGEISAISAATITSKAVTNGVNAAVTFFNTVLKGAQ